MSISFGYNGPAGMPSQFVDDPLTVMPRAVIRLCDWEIRAATAALQAGPWAEINASQRREVARYILERRDDPESQRQLDMLGINVPLYNEYEVICTGCEDLPSGSLIDHFLL